MQNKSIAKDASNAQDRLIEVSAILDTLGHFLEAQVGHDLPEAFVPGLEYIVEGLANDTHAALEELEYAVPHLSKKKAKGAQS